MSGDPRVPGAVCRINALPDDMLLLILSYLNARQVVQTCLLSRQWRNLWRSVPRINATSDEFEHMSDDYEEDTLLFKKFVNRFLMLRNPFALEDFRLWYDMPWESDDYSEDANIWICYALHCNARSVMVTVRDNTMHLDPSVFISGLFLRRLRLAGVALFPGFFCQLATGFTALKYLILHACDISDVEITSKTLKVLIMDIDCSYTFEEQCSISIPSLICLDYSTFQRIPLLKSMKSLERACAVLNTYYHTEVDDIRQFLKSLSGVTDLNFSYEGNMLNMGNIQWCPKFNNLTTLTLSQWCLHPDFYPLIVFLQNSPSLENLTLELRGRFIGELEERSFSCEHLDSVDIVCWGVQEHDPVLDNLVELLTENGKEPDEIHINI
ncbi:putative F-box/LRR-repeat protein At4g13960 isoform X2 [Miscanthus floridulus]|uniref:putative F-box/LRR-repeat protein At4g13960 isoform X2 n=1 Tax=Miscanthus floridulus TaxID=154761 RepID=UPI00345AB421